MAMMLIVVELVIVAVTVAVITVVVVGGNGSSRFINSSSSKNASYLAISKNTKLVGGKGDFNRRYQKVKVYMVKKMS